MVGNAYLWLLIFSVRQRYGYMKNFKVWRWTAGGLSGPERSSRFEQFDFPIVSRNFREVCFVDICISGASPRLGGLDSLNITEGTGFGSWFAWLQRDGPDAQVAGQVFKPPYRLGGLQLGHCRSSPGNKQPLAGHRSKNCNYAKLKYESILSNFLAVQLFECEVA